MQTTTPTRRRCGRAPATVPANGNAMTGDTAPSPPDPQVARLCANIRRLVAERDITLADLGRLIGYKNGNSFYNLMNGWSGNLSARTLIRVADVLGVTLDQLTGRQAAAASCRVGAAAAAPLVQAPKIAAALAEAQHTLETARAAIDTAEHTLRAAAALLPARRPAG